MPRSRLSSTSEQDPNYGVLYLEADAILGQVLGMITGRSVCSALGGREIIRPRKWALVD